MRRRRKVGSPFEEYFKETELNNSYKGVAREAWNAAVDQAADMVVEKLDESEPWITPMDIYKLSEEE